MSRVGSSLKVAGNHPGVLPVQTRVETAKTELPVWIARRWVPPPTAASSASKRVPPTPSLAEQRQGRRKTKMIPTPVRSVPDPTVGALRLPTSMQTRCDRFSRKSGYARRKDYAVSQTQTKQRFRTLAILSNIPLPSRPTPLLEVASTPGAATRDLEEVLVDRAVGHRDPVRKLRRSGWE